MLQVWLSNLGKYNEGFLDIDDKGNKCGAWFTLPLDDIEEALKSIGVSSEPNENGEYYEEYQISDFETDINGLTIDIYDNLEELNDLSKVLEDIEFKKDLKCFEAILECSKDFKEAIETYESERYIFLGEIDPEEYGREMLENCIDKKTLNIIENYFDFKSYGEEYLEDYNETSNGYIYFY